MVYHSKALHNYYVLGSFKELYRYLDTPNFCTTKEVVRRGVRGSSWREGDRTDDSMLASEAIIGDGDRKHLPLLVLGQFCRIFFSKLR